MFFLKYNTKVVATDVTATVTLIHFASLISDIHSISGVFAWDMWWCKLGLFLQLASSSYQLRQIRNLVFDKCKHERLWIALICFEKSCFVGYLHRDPQFWLATEENTCGKGASGIFLLRFHPLCSHARIRFLIKNIAFFVLLIDVWWINSLHIKIQICHLVQSFYYEELFPKIGFKDENVLRSWDNSSLEIEKIPSRNFKDIITQI